VALHVGLSDGLHPGLQDCCAHFVGGEPDRLGALFAEDWSLEVSPLGCRVSGAELAGAYAKAMSAILGSEVSLYDPTRWGNHAGARGHFVAETANGTLDFDFTIEIHLNDSGRITRLRVDFDADQRNAPSLRS
jgi:hypothetical protein